MTGHPPILNFLKRRYRPGGNWSASEVRSVLLAVAPPCVRGFRRGGYRFCDSNTMSSSGNQKTSVNEVAEAVREWDEHVAVASQVADELDVSDPTARKWLKRAHSEGKVGRQELPNGARVWFAPRPPQAMLGEYDDGSPPNLSGEEARADESSEYRAGYSDGFADALALPDEVLRKFLNGRPRSTRSRALPIGPNPNDDLPDDVVGSE